MDSNFIYRRDYKDRYLDQYSEHLQKQNYIDQITSALKGLGSQNAVQLEMQTCQIIDAMYMVSNNNLAAMISVFQSGIAELNGSFIQGFSLIEKQLQTTNYHLEKIETNSRLSEKQKDRIGYIEKGYKHYQMAWKSTDTDYYFGLALDQFGKALAIENDDFFPLYYTGRIYLWPGKYRDYCQAEMHLRKSAFLYLEEAKTGGTTFSKCLFDFEINFLQGARDANFYAADACYQQNKYNEAALLAGNAWEIDPKYNFAGYMQSLYLLAAGRIEHSVAIIEKLVKEDPTFFELSFSDTRIGSHPEIIKLLKKIHTEVRNDVFSMFRYWSEIIEPIGNKSSTLSDLIDLKNNTIKDNYLELIEAKKKMSDSKTWVLKEGAIINTEGVILPRISSLTYEGSIIEFAKFEVESILAIPTAEFLIKVKRCERQIYALKNRLKEDEEVKIIIKSKLNYLIFFCLFLLLIIICSASYSDPNSVISEKNIKIWIDGGMCIVLGIILAIWTFSRLRIIRTEIEKVRTETSYTATYIKQLREHGVQMGILVN